MDIQYTRNDIDFQRGTFRVRGDTIEIFPAVYSDTAVRVELFGDEIERLLEFEVLTGRALSEMNHIMIYPAKHHVVKDEKMRDAISSIEEELHHRLKELRDQGKILEAYRLEQRKVSTSRCSRRWGTVPGLKTTPGTLPAGLRASLRTPCWISSPRISWW